MDDVFGMSNSSGLEVAAVVGRADTLRASGLRTVGFG